MSVQTIVVLPVLMVVDDEDDFIVAVVADLLKVGRPWRL